MAADRQQLFFENLRKKEGGLKSQGFFGGESEWGTPTQLQNLTGGAKHRRRVCVCVC